MPLGEVLLINEINELGDRVSQRREKVLSTKNKNSLKVTDQITAKASVCPPE